MRPKQATDWTLDGNAWQNMIIGCVMRPIRDSDANACADTRVAPSVKVITRAYIAKVANGAIISGMLAVGSLLAEPSCTCVINIKPRGPLT